MRDSVTFSVFADLHWREGDWSSCESRLDVRGFLGSYEVTATSNGRTATTSIHLRPHNPTPLEITI